jgi:hypothetical protein
VSSRSLIPRLLSGRNRLSRPEKDEILANVLGEVTPGRRVRGRHGVLLALAGAVGILVLVPLAMRGGPDGARDAAFSARGISSAAAGFELVCPDGRPGICLQGDTLLFDLSGSAGHDYFAAFARHQDGTVIWYFPESPDGKSLELARSLSEGVLRRGVAVGDEHQPGRYRVHGIFSDTALTRDDIKERFEDGAHDLGPGTAVTTRELTVR